MAKIRLYRRGDNFGEWRKLWVYINDVRRGSVDYDKSQDFDVYGSSARIYVKMDWYRSAELKITIPEREQVVEVRCESPDSFCNGKPDGWFALGSIVRSFTSPNDYFRLQIVEN